jgi:hypothetical protein
MRIPKAIFILICMFFLTLPSAQALTNPQPVGIIAVKAIGVPAGTPSGSQLSWTFNNFVANATSSSPTCTLNLTQSLSVDSNSTLQAAPNPTTPLSNVYALDYTAYAVDAYNDTTNFKISGTLNITLNNHYIPNETWITSIAITIYGNTSITANTLANWYIYNFTGSAYQNLGLLNATSRTSLSTTLSSALATLIDEANSNSIMLKYNYTDTTNTDFLLHIDYIKIDVTYQFSITIQNWASTQSQTTLVTEPIFSYTDTFTLVAPSGITSHNFTVYYTTPNQALVTFLGSAPSVQVSGQSVTVSNWGFNITNLGSNVTSIAFLLPKMYIVNPSTDVTISGVSFQGGINKLRFTISGTGTKTIQIYAPFSAVLVYVDGSELSSNNYTLSNNILTLTLTLSTHTVEIYQKIAPTAPSGEEADTDTITPTPTPTPPPETQQVFRYFIIAVAVFIAVLIFLKLRD